MSTPPRIRIGELSRRAGVSPELLRAWETRYGLLDPERSQGGLRLYSEEDEQRVRRMLEHLATGIAAAEAARLAKLVTDPITLAPLARPSELLTAMERALEALDEGAVQAAVDRVLGTFALETALSEVILPFLHKLGERWADARVTVAQEHFASNIISGRLRALARGWGQGVGPRAVLACPPGERHELGLLCFGLVLRKRGWRITYFGAETPLKDIARGLEELDPAIIILSAVDSAPFVDSDREIAALARQARVALGGAGATSRLARTLGAEWLGSDLVRAARELVP